MNYGIITTMEWYTQTSEQIFTHFDSNENGLSKEQVLIKREKYGENNLPVAEKTTYFEIFLRQLIN